MALFGENLFTLTVKQVEKSLLNTYSIISYGLASLVDFQTLKGGIEADLVEQIN